MFFLPSSTILSKFLPLSYPKAANTEPTIAEKAAISTSDIAWLKRLNKLAVPIVPIPPKDMLKNLAQPLLA